MTCSVLVQIAHIVGVFKDNPGYAVGMLIGPLIIGLFFFKISKFIDRLGRKLDEEDIPR